MIALELLATLESAPEAPAVGPAPIQVLYGGAHLFSANAPAKLGELARRTFRDYAADAFELDATVRDDVLTRVERKLASEPIEDLRIDFEDGFGVRSETEEDETAVRAAKALAELRDGPRHIGIRVKSLEGASAGRAARTLELFLTTLGKAPPRFVVTLPKVTNARSVDALAAVLPEGIGIELMVEHPRALFAEDGRLALPLLIRAARGRCVAVHLGTFDLTAAVGVAAAHQTPDHPYADFARHLMLTSVNGTSVRVSDGATTILPIAPHRAPSSDRQRDENRNVMHAALRRHYADVRRALRFGIYQSWDLHPAQLVSHYAAVFAFFREALPSSSARLRTFVEQAARASRVGEVFDDAATGQGLLNFFLRGVDCGAIDDSELAGAGVTRDDLRTRSFATIIDRRSNQSPAPSPR